MPFVTFEGVEGCGKSTQLALAAARLRAAGRAVTTTREPGGTPIGEKIRAILVDPRHACARPGRGMAPDRGGAAPARARRGPPGARGRRTVVLCDRFSDSTEAYQAAGRGLDAGLDRRRRRARARRPRAGPDARLRPAIRAEGLARARRRDADSPGRFEAEELALPRARARAPSSRSRGASPTASSVVPVDGTPRSRVRPDLADPGREVRPRDDARDRRGPRAARRRSGAVPRRTAPDGTLRSAPRGGVAPTRRTAAVPRRRSRGRVLRAAAASGRASTRTSSPSSPRACRSGRPRPGGPGVRGRPALRERAPRRADPARRPARRRRQPTRCSRRSRSPGERFRWILTTTPPGVAPADDPFALHGRRPCPPRARPSRPRSGRSAGSPKPTRATWFSSSARTARRIRPPGSPRGGRSASPSSPRSRRASPGGRPAVLLLLAEAVASLEQERRPHPRRDPRRRGARGRGPAVAGPPSPAVAGQLAEIARRTGPAVLRDAAVAAADPPAGQPAGQPPVALRKSAARTLGTLARALRVRSVQAGSAVDANGLGLEARPDQIKTRRNDGEPPAQRARKDREECGPGSYQTDGRCGKLGWQTPPSPPLP